MSAEDPKGLPARDHFSRLAKSWSQFGPPLRPTPEDSAIVQRLVDGLAPATHAVVLGMTPEIIGCCWPAGTDLVAADHSEEMIRSLWRQEAAPPGARAIVADWRKLPIADGTIDFIIGDGVMTLVEYPAGWHELVRELRRVLRPAGTFVMRAFLRPEGPESIEAIAAALERDEVETVHALKLHLHALVHGRNGYGSRLSDAWEVWKTIEPLVAARLGTPGWTPGELESVESYRGLDARYYLASFGEIRDVFSTAFSLTERIDGSHSIGDRCPTLVFVAGANA